MTEFELDWRLQRDCIELARVDGIRVLLLNNALVQWFVLVPETDVTELHELPPELRGRLDALQDKMARFVKETYKVDKLNIAAIGNVVSQMHIHIIGRNKNDYAWPGVVWGREESEAYADPVVDHICERLTAHLGL